VLVVGFLSVSVRVEGDATKKRKKTRRRRRVVLRWKRRTG